MFDKVNKSYSSYFALRKLGKNANPPKYKNKNDLCNLILCGKAINNRDNNKNFIEIQMGDGTKIRIIKPNLLLKQKNFIEIKRVEVIPKYGGYGYDACIGYVNIETNINENKKYETVIKDDLRGIISVDLGMKNLMTIYNPRGTQKIIKGNILINSNEYYNKKIAKSKSDNIKSNKNKVELSKKTKKLLTKRENVLNHKMDVIVSDLYKEYNNKKEIIIGYNKEWKKHVKMGRNNNRKFYDIPYRRLISKIRNKFKTTKIIEVWEGYTSKCDALSLESIKKHEKYNGKRIKRGLFKSGTNVLINADLNGAINIMRRYLKNQNIKYEKIEGFNLLNPQRLRITN